MARINTLRLAVHAVGVAEGIARANYVRQDPAVVKAAKVAMTDIAQAGRSAGNLAREIQSAWSRHIEPTQQHGRPWVAPRR